MFGMKILLTLFVLLFSSSMLAEEWIIYESDGDIKVFKFHSDYRCSYINIKSYSGNEGASFSVDETDCNWKKNSNLLFWELNNYFSVRTAIINGSKMSGKFTSIYNGGSHATFTGEKVK